MATEVAVTSPVSDASLGQSQQRGPEGPNRGPKTYAEQNAHDPQDLRLVIEEDKAAGCYVYKTIDRRTGVVVQQLPREQVLRLRETINYTAGDVINAKA